MSNRRKDTPKRPHRQWKPAEIAVIITALGTFLTGLAALRQRPEISLSPPVAPFFTVSPHRPSRAVFCWPLK